MTAKIVEWKEVVRQYGPSATAPGLKHATLTLHAGETVAIVGPSGAGKSTALNILGLLDRPSTGDYRLCGVDTLTCSSKDLAHLRAKTIGFVFQSFHLMTERTAAENVAIGLMYGFVARETWPDLVASALDDVGLGNRTQYKCKNLSGGECQRVAIARAIVSRPRLLLADEPTGNLDQATGAAVLNAIMRARTEDGAQVIVTHDARVAARCDRTFRLVDGVLSGDVL